MKVEIPKDNFWLTADWHLGHKNILKYCDRPFNNIEEMHNIILENYNSIIQKDGLCIHVGDFALYNSPAELEGVLKKMNGRKILIRGNHDRFTNNKFRVCGFEYVTKSLQIDEYRILHHPHRVKNFEENKFICGHVHNVWKKRTYDDKEVVNIGIDVWDFKPVHFTEVKKLFGTEDKKMIPKGVIENEETRDLGCN